MPLSEADVRAIADYARIELSDEELPAMVAYMNDAVEMLAPVRAMADAEVEPTFMPTGSQVNVMRADEVGASLDRELALSNAGATKDGQFRVPSILGEGSEA